MTGQKLSYVPPRGGRHHLRSLIAGIDRLTPAGTWDPARVTARAGQLLQRRGVVVVISDFYDGEEATRREMRRMTERGHDVAMLQLISPEEVSYPSSGQVDIEDLETGERRLIDGAEVAAAYNAAFTNFLDRCRREALRDGVDYALISTDRAPESALRDYLLRRGRRDVATSGPRTVTG
jgi:uncharacterized protein (DUF58 family)